MSLPSTAATRLRLGKERDVTGISALLELVDGYADALNGRSPAPAIEPQPGDDAELALLRKLVAAAWTRRATTSSEGSG